MHPDIAYRNLTPSSYIGLGAETVSCCLITYLKTMKMKMGLVRSESNIIIAFRTKLRADYISGIFANIHFRTFAFLYPVIFFIKFKVPVFIS
jgi:hypothetical protein